MPFIRWAALEKLAPLGLNFHSVKPPLSSKFLILCLLVYFFSVSWINQEEIWRRARILPVSFHQFCQLTHPISAFKPRTLPLVLIFPLCTLWTNYNTITNTCRVLSKFYQPLLQILLFDYYHNSSGWCVLSSLPGGPRRVQWINCPKLTQIINYGNKPSDSKVYTLFTTLQFLLGADPDFVEPEAYTILEDIFKKRNTKVLTWSYEHIVRAPLRALDGVYSSEVLLGLIFRIQFHGFPWLYNYLMLTICQTLK